MSIFEAMRRALDEAGYPFPAPAARCAKNALDVYLRAHPSALMALNEDQGLAVATDTGWEFIANPLLDLAEQRDRSEEL